MAHHGMVAKPTQPVGYAVGCVEEQNTSSSKWAKPVVQIMPKGPQLRDHGITFSKAGVIRCDCARMASGASNHKVEGQFTPPPPDRAPPGSPSSSGCTKLL